MAAKEVNEILVWLGENFSNISFTMEEVKELLEIERLKRTDVLGPWAESLPQNIVDEIIAEERNSSDNSILEKKANTFREKFAEKFKK